EQERRRIFARATRSVHNAGGHRPELAPVVLFIQPQQLVFSYGCPFRAANDELKRHAGLERAVWILHRAIDVAAAQPAGRHGLKHAARSPIDNFRLYFSQLLTLLEVDADFLRQSLVGDGGRRSFWFAAAG